MPTYQPPKYCETCHYFWGPAYRDYGGQMIEPPGCSLSVFLPRRKKAKGREVIDKLYNLAKEGTP